MDINMEILKIVGTAFVTGFFTLLATKVQTKANVDESRTKATQLIIDTYQEEFKTMREENSGLKKQLDEVIRENKQLKETVDRLNNKIDKLSRALNKYMERENDHEIYE